MTHCSPRSNPFILEAFDCDLWGPVAQTLFHVADMGSLRSILRANTDNDPELDRTYYLDDGQIAVWLRGSASGSIVPNWNPPI
jgi:hypothetical protein